jgi:DNA-3-methyladenine glycosylase
VTRNHLSQPGIDARLDGPAQSVLDTRFYVRDAVVVAHDLVGCVLCRTFDDGSSAEGMIVETEAYREDDPASHSYRGITDRSRVMFGPPGIAYVYFIYGMYDCLNVVCEPEGFGAAVLIRAVHPTAGIDVLWKNRYGTDLRPSDPQEAKDPDERAVRNLTSGPGKLCRAFAVTKARHNGRVLSPAPESRMGDSIYIVKRARREIAIVSSIRVGVSHGTDREWRFCAAGDPFVSLNPPARRPSGR